MTQSKPAVTRRESLDWDVALTFCVVAAGVFVIAFKGGSFTIGTRGTLAVALWWALLLMVAAGFWPLARIPLAALVAGAGLTALVVWTGLSMVWGESSEDVLSETNRSATYLAVFAISICAARRRNAIAWCDGLAAGLVAVAIVALTSRLFPGTFSVGQLPRFLPSTTRRLSFPVDYWNGLGILVALAIPLLLRAATTSRSAVWRALGLGPIPAVVATIFLTSSRGGMVAALVGALFFLSVAADRWRVLAALAVSLAGSAVAVRVIDARPAVTAGATSHVAAAQGRTAALFLLLACLVVGSSYAIGVRYLTGRVALSRRIGRSAAALLLLLIVVGLVAVHPVARVHEFKSYPSNLNRQSIQEHLLSGSGTGRWQMWSTAIREFRTQPLHGRGAGSFAAWWAQYGSLPLSVKDAHSLYAETLGELGVIGLLFLLVAFVPGLAAAAFRLRHGSVENRMLTAACFSAFAAFVVAAAYDWIWELPIVPVVGFILLGLLVGPATAVVSEPNRQAEGGLRPVYRIAFGVTAVAAIVAQAIPLLAGVNLDASRAAAARGDIYSSARAAARARDLEPWATSPYQQLALVAEQAGDYRQAERWIQQAGNRDPDDWRVWLLAARIQTKAGHLAQARASLERAERLGRAIGLLPSPTSSNR